MIKTYAKTSTTHPIRIDWVTPANVPGRIGLTFCPGKKVKNSISGGDWDRDIDLDAIAGSGALVLVTLIEAHEFDEMGVKELAGKVKSQGLAWYHLPIPDKGIPDKIFEEKWIRTGSDLRARLFSGDDIVIHCKGGLGRTGLVAARLLIELGEDNQSVIQKVRIARPGVVETEEQEDYLKWINFKD